MIKLKNTSFLLCSLLGHMTFSMTAQAGVEGLWLTENKRSAIHLYSCEETKICGDIAWIIDDGMQFDTKNPDESKRDTPLCGMTILHSFVNDPKNTRRWKDGTVYKADEGDMYDAYFVEKSESSIKFRGYAGISLFGKTQMWTRVSEEDYPQCTIPAQ